MSQWVATATSILHMKDNANHVLLVKYKQSVEEVAIKGNLVEGNNIVIIVIPVETVNHFMYKPQILKETVFSLHVKQVK